MTLSINLTRDELMRIKPVIEANQQYPRKFYVYAHTDMVGKIFYIGKGAGRRAWSTDRHALWTRYVNKHLKGQYQVKILYDNLSAEDAEDLENSWILWCGDSILNCFNLGRDDDYDASAKRYKLRSTNRFLIQQAQASEKDDLEKAVTTYIQTIDAIQSYAHINFYKGLHGQLVEEEASELGVHGEIQALDRLTMCLIKLGRPTEAAEHTDKYFALYRRDLEYKAAMRIKKRISKALANMKQNNTKNA